jgi:hypothetical protein
MPQFDFRQLFPAPPPKVRPPKAAVGLDEETSDPDQGTPLFDLNRSQWTNIGFVAAACAGALISALYFFNGAELFRQAAMWPGELLYTRPPSPAHAPSPKTAASPLPGEAAAGALNGEKATSSNSGDPFSSAKQLLNLNPTSPFSSPRSNTSSSSGNLGAPQFTSSLNQLGQPVPGGDALSKALTQDAIDSAQSRLATAKNTVAALPTTRMQSQRRASSHIKTATGRVSGVRSTIGATGTKSTAHATSTGSLRSSVSSDAANTSNVGRAAATLNPSISPGQQLRGLGGVGSMNLGAGNLMGHPGGR